MAPAVRGGRGRRGRAGGHGARARHERWQQWRGQSGLAAAAGAGVAGAAPVAGPDKIIDPCTAGAGSHGSSRPPVTRRAVASPLTPHLSPLGPAGLAGEGSTANSSSFSNLFWRSWADRAGEEEGAEVVYTQCWRLEKICPADAAASLSKHSVCLPPFVTFQILSQTLQFEETGLRRAAVQWAGELAVLRAEGRGSGLGGSGVEYSVERRGGVEGRVSRVTRATWG